MTRLKGKLPQKAKWEKDLDKGYTHASQQGFYNTSRWKKTRKYVLDHEPLCRMCLEKGKIRPASMVDHIIPIQDDSDEELAYGFDNLQPLCESCHRVKTNMDQGKRSAANLAKGRDLMNDLES